MNVRFTPSQEALIRQAIEAGRLHTVDEAVKEAMALWEERERRRTELLEGLDKARASVARGEGIPVTRQSMRELAEDVKRSGRDRLAAERQAPG